MAPSKSLVHQAVWQKTIRTAVEPARVKHYVEQLQSTPLAAELTAVPPELARILAALFSGSVAMSDLAVAHPEWLQPMSLDAYQYPRQEQGLRREVNSWFEPALRDGAYGKAFVRLRHFKQREMLRIAARDLARLGKTAEIIREISDVADVCLSSVLRLCRAQIEERLGRPWHLDADERWQPTEFVVMGLGKLGGQELNYSSDVDVIFVYSEEGNVFRKPPTRNAKMNDRALSNHQFFKRLAEAFVTELTRATPDGTLYRVDVRLRPEGDSGPIVRSLPSYENYYAQWGQTWERMMLIKARAVAGDAGLAHEFMEMIQPFRYPRSLGEGVLREIAGIKERIENEVVRAGELERNVKLGRGGIREIEFGVQTLQLLHAGRIPFLQGAQTLPALDKLAEYHLLERAEARQLTAAYCFLRDVEHRLQMEHNLQTHTIPVEPKAAERLARLMGLPTAAAFETARKEEVTFVRRTYDRLLRGESPADNPSQLPRGFDEAAGEWKKILADHSFRDVEKAFRLLKEFTHGPGYVHVSNRTVELARALVPKILALCPHPGWKQQNAKIPVRVLSDPDRVLARIDSFIGVYGARATLFETWNSNPALFELLLWLFDRSEFLAETAIRTPDLVDELVLTGRLVRQKYATETLTDLQHGRGDKDQRLWLRRYHQAELMRIGLREILGLADFEQNLLELSALADACLQYALEVVLRRHKLKKSPLVIIGLGKLGGQELNYGSDLDIMFVAESARKLPKLQRLAVEIMEMLSSPTELGVAFLTDARLRPDGEKGPLVNTLPAYEQYYRHRAQLWELQVITRTRPVAGNMALGEQFQQRAALLTNFKQPSLPLAAYRPEWKTEIARMRHRIEKERTPPGKDALAIKTGLGGLMDAEFAAQIFCLANGWHEANTLSALQRARAEGVLPQRDADQLIENYRQLRRIEGILRRWSYEGETVLPDQEAPLYRVAVRCGWSNAEEFLEGVQKVRRAIREAYARIVESTSG